MKLIIENFVTMVTMIFITTIFFSILQVETELLMHQNMLYAKVEETSNNNLNYTECEGFNFEKIEDRAIKITHSFDISTTLFKTIYEDYQIEVVAR